MLVNHILQIPYTTHQEPSFKGLLGGYRSNRTDFSARPTSCGFIGPIFSGHTGPTLSGPVGPIFFRSHRTDPLRSYLSNLFRTHRTDHFRSHWTDRFSGPTGPIDFQVPQDRPVFRPNRTPFSTTLDRFRRPIQTDPVVGLIRPIRCRTNRIRPGLRPFFPVLEPVSWPAQNRFVPVGQLG